MQRWRLCNFLAIYPIFYLKIIAFFRKKLSSKTSYTPAQFEDPALHTKWKTLEGLALGREDVESVDDLALPDCDCIDRRLGQRSTIFSDLVFPLGYQSRNFQASILTPRDPQHEATVEDAARNGWVRFTFKQF